jgi:peroxiredoxin family protein
MANGARMEGIEADLFFTFFGLDAIRKDRFDKIKVATVGNPGLHMPTWIGTIPGFSLARHEDDDASDGEDRHPADPGVH